MLPKNEEFWIEYRYIQKYGEKKMASEFITYEIITGKNWADVLKTFDSISYSIEKFHKEVVLPLLLKNEDAKIRLIDDFVSWLEDESKENLDDVIYSLRNDAPESAKNAYKIFCDVENYLCKLMRKA